MDQAKVQALKIFQRNKKEDEKHQKDTAIPGLPQTKIGRTPDNPESTDVIPSMLAGDPENTALLDETFKKLYEEIQFLQSQPKKGILDGLNGPRKWRMAGRLALKPWLRGEFEKKVNDINDERIQKRRDLMLRIGQELRVRSVDPVQKAYYESVAKKLGAQEGDRAARERDMLDLDDAVGRGLISEGDRENAVRWGFAPKLKANKSASEQTMDYLGAVNPLLTFARMSKLDPKGADAFVQFARDSGLQVTDALETTLRSTIDAGNRVKPPAGETDVQRQSRELREARMQWTPMFNYIKQQNTKKVPLNWDEVKAAYPDITIEEARDEGLLVEDSLPVLPIEELLRLTRAAMEKYTSVDPAVLDRFSTLVPSEPGEDGSDPASDARAAQDYQDYLDSLEN